MAVLIASGHEIPVSGGITVEEAVRSVGMHPDSYLYLIGGTPVPMDTVIPEDAEVKVLRVASGG